MKFIKIIALFAILSLTVACSSLIPGASAPPCVGSINKALEISWGESVAKTNQTMGYRLKSDGSLYLIRTVSDGSLQEELVTKLKGEAYCNLKNQVEQTILKQQTYSSPGEKFRFIEYKDPNSGLLFRALWNPVSNNLGAKAFIDLYNVLMGCVPSLKDVK